LAGGNTAGTGRCDHILPKKTAGRNLMSGRVSLRLPYPFFVYAPAFSGAFAS
jgi:hypothetical protein